MLGEPRDVGVGALLVGNYITASSSCTVPYKGEAIKWGQVTLLNCLNVSVNE